MAAQAITTELREWIVAQASAGHSPESVLAAMRTSGWDEATALDALETTLEEHLALAPGGAAVAASAKTVASVASLRKTANAALPPSVPVPGASLGAADVVVDAGDRQVRVLLSMQRPRVVVFGDLVAPDECEALVALAQARLARSETVDTRTGDSEVNDARTSDGMFFEPAEFDVCARIERRIARLVGWPLENGEGLQILRYRPGAEYKPHYDYFDPDEPGTPAILKRGGQRVASLVCYLTTPARGGATVFPDVGLEVAALAGNAVFFSYDRPHPTTRSLHGGAPVEDGEKWVATKWMRERKFE